MLLKTTETHFVLTEEEALKLIEDAKESNEFELIKYSNEHKVKKSKGMIVLEYQIVSLTKQYNDLASVVEDQIYED
jgi:hypothetical protein